MFLIRKNKVDTIYCCPAFSLQTFDILSYVVCLLIQLKYMEIFAKALEVDI